MSKPRGSISKHSHALIYMWWPARQAPPFIHNGELSPTPSILPRYQYIHSMYITDAQPHKHQFISGIASKLSSCAQPHNNSGIAQFSRSYSATITVVISATITVVILAFSAKIQSISVCINVLICRLTVPGSTDFKQFGISCDDLVCLPLDYWL